jgi:hypothetical protein
VSLERFVYHVVNDGARSVEGAGLFAGSGFGLLVVRGEKILEDLTKQLGIESNFLIDGCVFNDGKLVAIEDIDQTADFCVFLACEPK